MQGDSKAQGAIFRQFETTFDIASDAQIEAFEYWRGLRRTPSGMPAQDSFKLIELPPKILPTTHVVDVLQGGREFRFRFWGSRLIEYLGYEGTGRTTSELEPRIMGAKLDEVFKSMVESRRAIAMVSEFERSRSKVVGFQKFIRMPLAAPDGSVGRIVSLVEFLVDRHEALKALSYLGTTVSGTGDGPAGQPTQR